MTLVQNIKVFAIFLVVVEVIFAVFGVVLIWKSGNSELTISILQTTVISMFTFINLYVVLFLLKRLSQMENIVKVCAWTKKIEMDGKWVSIEEFLEKHLGVKISHGMAVEAAHSLQKTFHVNTDDTQGTS